MDNLRLMIRQIPLDLSEDQLADIMTNYGQRHVESVKIIRKPDFASYYGFVHFVSHTDALEAFEELDKQPPLYLSIEFARKQRDEKSKVYSGSGNSVSSKERGKDERVTFDGPMPHLKVRLDSEGRKVTLKRQSGHQFIDRDLDLLPEAPNQLFFCFVCGREGIYACKFCRKPYCSKNCQGIDFVSHQAFCKKAKILAETLLCCYKYFPVECFDSGDSEHEKVDPVNDLLFPSGTPPSIWSKLKIGAKMQLVQVFANEDSVWCYLVNGQSDLDACSILDNRLLDYSGEDITLTAKEGDFAAGFSKKYKNYYRCRVLKIMKKIFLVHFIDYGNKEEITQLRALSEELLQKCCYLVKCEKPTNLSLTEFSNFLGNDIKVTIDKVDQNVAQISFHHTNELSITCYPCYSNISTKQTFVIEDSGVSEGKVSLPSSNIKPIPTFHCDDYKVSSEKIASKCLSSANYSVRAVFIRSASELYVQLREDEFQISKMHNDLNSFCNSKRNSYVPNIGEIVSCKFTDNAWYRGKVLEKLNNNDYKVFFVDYGNEDIVSQSDIKVLSDRFLFPQFSICVSLIGVKNKDISKGILDKLLKEDWDMKVIDSNKTPKEVMLFQKNVPITGMITKKNRSNLKFQKLPDKATVKICFEDGKYLYVNQVKDIQSLEEMSVKLNSYSELPAPTCPVVNNVYSGLFDDGLFYRVCIKKQISSDSFEAYFLDYGNYGTVKTSDLREIPEDLFDLPVYCTPVLVEDRKELTLRSDAEYTVEVIRMEGKVQLVKFSQVNEPIVQSPFIPPSLSSFTNSCLPLNESCKVVFKKNVNDLHIAVKLDDYEEMERMNSLLQESKTDIINHLPSVNEVLLAKMDDLWYRCSVVSMLSEENICEVHFIDIGITEHVPTFEMRYLPDACKAFPLFAIKILVESDQPVILDKCYNIYVLNKMSDDIYNVKVYHQYKYSSIHRKELVPMKVSDVIFYHKEGEILFLQNISDIEILAEIQKILVNCSSNSCISYKPDVGELVCAMSQQDNSWYRGCIEEVLTFDEYKVLFIDYGNFENVQRNNMQPLPFALTKFPSLVIPVKIQHNEVIEFEKVYKVVADSNASSGIQSVTIVENNEVLNNTEQKSTSSTPTNCDADKKFDFMGCKAVPFNLGDQDIVIYSVDDEGFIYCAPFNIDNIEANMYLPDIITEHCNNQGIQFEGSQPQLGEMVLALYSVDKRWYRAVVIENSHPQYHVNFIDYGNSETLNIKCLRKMEEKFMELDLQSHMCSISGFTFPPENKMKVISELKKCDFFSSPEPVRANVKIIDQDYIVNIPSMTSHLVNKNLATADDNSLSFLCNSSEK